VSNWALRRAVIETARRTLEVGLTHGTSGNVSARAPEGFLITPTGVPYADLQPSDIVLLDAGGSAGRRQRRPSSEWRIHRDVYAARPEVGAVVHVHAPFTTTLACLRRDLPAVHYLVGVAGGSSVRCATYATFGTEELSRNTLAALEGRTACLLANHGLVALGRNLAAAFRVALEVERAAELYWRTLAVGEPVVLDHAEMERVIERLRDYGRSAQE
jgi:L-fuculose-phosphate aldolase